MFYFCDMELTSFFLVTWAGPLPIGNTQLELMAYKIHFELSGNHCLWFCILKKIYIILYFKLKIGSFIKKY